MTKRNASEQSIAEVVVAWLEALGADVYQEVEILGGIADIVARVGVEVWIVEVKTSLSLALVTQGMERRRYAHRVYIAAPRTKNMRDVAMLCEEVGIGLLQVTPGETFRGDIAIDPRVREMVASRRWNTRPVALADKLKPQHKTHAKAGAIGAGGRWTPFRATCEELAAAARAKPGITLKEAIDGIRHHYSTPRSAMSSLAHWIERGKVPGVRLARSHGACGAQGALCVFPTEVAA